jgi:hypothetical protein
VLHGGDERHGRAVDRSTGFCCHRGDQRLSIGGCRQDERLSLADHQGLPQHRVDVLGEQPLGLVVRLATGPGLPPAVRVDDGQLGGTVLQPALGVGEFATAQGQLDGHLGRDVLADRLDVADPGRLRVVGKVEDQRERLDQAGLADLVVADHDRGTDCR